MFQYRQYSDRKDVQMILGPRGRGCKHHSYRQRSDGHKVHRAAARTHGGSVPPVHEGITDQDRTTNPGRTRGQASTRCWDHRRCREHTRWQGPFSHTQTYRQVHRQTDRHTMTRMKVLSQTRCWRPVANCLRNWPANFRPNCTENLLKTSTISTKTNTLVFHASYLIFVASSRSLIIIGFLFL